MTLRIYGECIEMCREVGIAARLIEKRDGDLARQLRRAAASVVLNVSEGAYSSKGNERARWSTALGSAAEVRAALDVALAFGYVGTMDVRLRGLLEKIIATLWKLTR